MSSQQRRKSYTVKFKLQVIKWYHENGSNAHAAANHFGINRSSVIDWLAKEDQLKKAEEPETTRHICGWRARYSVLDAEIFDFLSNERSAGRSVSNKQLMDKALDIAPKLNVPGTFKASCMWLKRWKQRNKVSMRCDTNDSQKLPVDYWNMLQVFRTSIIQQRAKYNIKPAHIFNMDQTMCRFDMVPTRTNDSIGRKSIRIVSTKATKKGFTVALCANGAGEKVPAVIIFKENGGKLGPRVREKINCPPNVLVMASTNGWMTSNLYHWWLNTVYGSDMAARRLLLVDNYKAHVTDESKRIVNENCNSELIFVPAGCTSLVQPMDVSIN